MFRGVVPIMAVHNAIKEKKFECSGVSRRQLIHTTIFCFASMYSSLNNGMFAVVETW